MMSTIFLNNICVNNDIATAPVQPNGPMKGTEKALPPMPPMSNEEQMLAQQLDSVFEELTKNMSENEKNQFFNELNVAMEQEIEKMSNMTDEELNNYIKEAEKELQDLGPWPEESIEKKPTPEPVAPTAPAKPEKSIGKEKDITKPSKDMVPTIDAITARIDSFIQKANQVVQMSSYFEKWGKKGNLQG